MRTPKQWVAETVSAGDIRLSYEGRGKYPNGRWMLIRDKAEQLEAERLLIAAAPDLLEALQNLLTFPLGTFQVQAAQAAIAKAEGQA